MILAVLLMALIEFELLVDNQFLHLEFFQEKCQFILSYLSY